MSIRLLEDLQTGEYDTAVFLTFTINLRFFELMILPRLRRMGVSRIGILIDQRGYQNSLTDPLRPEFCGREYILDPVRLSHGGIQHAKLLWLQKKETITAYLGSHNLTPAGYNDQAEVTAKLTSIDSGHIQALRDLHEVVTSIMPSALHYVWEHTEPPPVINEPSTAIALTSYSQPLIGQIIDHVQTADELRIVTPFLDAFALKTLVEAVHAQTVVLDLPKEGANIPLFEAVEAVTDLRARYLENEDRRLHAKAYQFTTSHTSWLAIGSANCTQAALIKSVAEGGNLEFLLLLKDMTLTDDDLIFTSIDDTATFPHTGRNWDASPLPSTPIIIEKASYKNKQLSVEWRLPKNEIVSDIALFADGNSVSCNTLTTASVSFDIAPRLITLKANIDGNSVESSAWVINYDALDQKVSQTKLHQWVERIASDDPQQQANSITEWLEQEFQELIQVLRESKKPDFTPQFEPAPKLEKLQANRQFYEVFTYSSDSNQVRASARALMETYPNMDPLVLLRVLLMRFTAESSIVLPPYINGNGELQPPGTQQNFLKHKAVAQNIVKNLNHQLDRFMKAEISWSDMPEKFLVDWLRTLFGTVAYIGLSAVEDAKSNEAETLVLRYITLLEWIDSIPTVKLSLQKPKVKGLLILSIGAVAKIAERCKDLALYPQLQKYSKKFIKGDPQQVITAWKKFDPQDADELLTQPKQGDIWQKIEAHVLAIFEIAPDHVKQRIKQRWGFLLELQEADMHLSLKRKILYAQAKAKCPDMLIWACYDNARRMRHLPVIFETTKNRCPKCFELLPAQKWQRLKKGEAVICDGCHQILLLKG